MTYTKVIAFILIFFVNGAFFIPRSFAIFDCVTLTNASSQQDKDFCKKELVDLEKQLADLIKKQKEQQKQTGTLKGDVDYLTSQINALQTKVKARAVAIAQLKISIKQKVSKIESLSEKIKKEHESLAQLLRNTNEFDNKNLIHLIISNENISEFYNDVASYASIKRSIKESVEEITGVKIETEFEKKDLEKKHDAELNAKTELENAQKKVAASEIEKKKLLAISKEKESAYQLLANEKKARADKIRAALFPLRDSVAIPFGTALEYAEKAEKLTGVRPAFVLAILQQESNLGANVGSCVITNLETGETKGVNSGKVFAKGIHPTRDLPLLQTIVKEVGRDPLTTRVSCPLSVGYGGAMGPAQFIPSTWNIIKKQLATFLKKSVPDPWNPLDAIVASAILLRDNGASPQTFTAEREAACKYYSGRGCFNPGVQNMFYGNGVMERATKIQADIDLLYND